jgi:hypothetical protein
MALAAAHIQGRRHPFLLGLTAVALPILRPTDALMALPPLAACLLVDWHHRRLRWRDAAAFAVAVLALAVLYGALHVRIYGWRPSFYMTMSADIGFTLHNLGWKAYVILVDPTAWIGGGEGLLRRAPWMILGVAGLVTALRRPITAMLAITLTIHSLLYISYVDLLPTGFWRFLNVHYWTWSFPGFALLALMLLRDLLARDRRRLAAVSMAGVLAILCIHLDPRPASDGASVDALDYAVPNASFDPVYFGDLTLHDADGTLANIKQVRAITLPGTIRVLTLTRSLHGDVAAIGDGLNDVTPTRLHIMARLGIPFWPWHRPDGFFGPQ